MNLERKRENLRAERARKATIHRLRHRCRPMPVVWTPRVSLDARKNTRCKFEIRKNIVSLCSIYRVLEKRRSH